MQTPVHKQNLHAMTSVAAEPARPAARAAARKRAWSATAGAALLIGAVVYLAHGLLHRPLLHYDDWTLVLENLTQVHPDWLDLGNRRPLLHVPFLLPDLLFGLNLAAHSWFLLVYLFAIALLLYQIIVTFPLLHRRVFALAVALLFVVHPANYSHMWFSSSISLLAFAMGLGAMYLLLRFVRNGSWAWYGAAFLLVVASIAMYELHLGVIALWVVGLALFTRGLAPARRWALLLVLLYLALFIVWRSVGYQLVGIRDTYLAETQVSPGALLYRLFQGYKIVIFSAWPAAMSQLWHTSLAKITLAAALLAVVVLCGLAAWLATRPTAAASERRGWLRWDTSMQHYALAAGLGLLIIGAGYIPVIVLYLPSLSNTDTRIHLVAIVGVSLFLASVLMMVSLQLGGAGRRPLIIFGAFLAPLLLFATVTQMQIKRDHVAAWQEQQALWRQVLASVPDLQDGTTLLLVLHGQQDRFGYETWQRPPLGVWWEVESAVRVLYDNRSLYGALLLPDVDFDGESLLLPDGVQNAELQTTTPYTRVAAFEYAEDGSGGEVLRRLSALPPEWVPGANAAMPTCTDCVIERTTPPSVWLSLVQ